MTWLLSSWTRSLETGKVTDLRGDVFETEDEARRQADAEERLGRHTQVWQAETLPGMP